MRSICLSFVAVAVLGRLAAADGTASRSPARIQGCHVTQKEQADLSPQEPGTIREIKVIEGQQVAKGELLLQLDDSKVQEDLKVAQRKLEAAKTKFDAANINVIYAKAAKDVADAELKTNKKANEDVPRTVPQVRIKELELKCTETELAIDKAASDQKLAEKEAQVAAAEADAAKVIVARHKVVSPIAGEIVDVRFHQGEAVQPTQPVIRVMNLGTLWVQGDVPGRNFGRAELQGQEVTVNFVIPPRGEKGSLPGKVIFVKPTTDTGNTYMVRAKVENRKVNGSWLLSPGMAAEMNIQLGRPSLDTSSR